MDKNKIIGWILLLVILFAFLFYNSKKAKEHQEELAKQHAIEQTMAQAAKQYAEENLQNQFDSKVDTTYNEDGTITLTKYANQENPKSTMQEKAFSTLMPEDLSDYQFETNFAIAKNLSNVHLPSVTSW